MAGLFGTSGIRGVYGKAVSPALAMRPDVISCSTRVLLSRDQPVPALRGANHQLRRELLRIVRIEYGVADRFGLVRSGGEDYQVPGVQ